MLCGLDNLITILLLESSYQNHLRNRRILALVWILPSSSLVTGKHWHGSEVYCEQWRNVTVFMEVFQSATDVHKRSCDHFSSEPLLQFMVYCQYEKVIKKGSIAENYKINSGCPRSGRVVTTIALTHIWNHFQVTPISLRFVLGGVDKLALLCVPWFAAIDLFFEHTSDPAVMWV